MRLIIIFFILIGISSLSAQAYIKFSDSIFFIISPRIDTFYVNNTPEIDSLSIDLDCDGIVDLRIKCHSTPFLNLPRAHHIDLENLVGADVEMLNGQSILQGFRQDEIIDLDTTQGWESNTIYSILYFDVLSGASWAGIQSRDSSHVTNMYVVFRKRIQNVFHYGWINYSGNSFPARLYLEELSFDREQCILSEVPSISMTTSLNIYPNPFHDELFINWPIAIGCKAIWKIFNVLGRCIEEGKISDGNPTCQINMFHTAKGIYLLQLFDEDKLVMTKPILRL
ncbi:MAG: T9SS type A sorting domain-containing protein [Saprospiraceae bacterium]